MNSDCETQVVAAERVAEYAEIESEAPSIVEGYRPPNGWPSQGTIQFKGTTMRYRPGTSAVGWGGGGGV